MSVLKCDLRGDCLEYVEQGWVVESRSLWVLEGNVRDLERMSWFEQAGDRDDGCRKCNNLLLWVRERQIENTPARRVWYGELTCFNSDTFYVGYSDMSWKIHPSALLRYFVSEPECYRV